MLTLISVIIVLGLLIFFHELGHFTVAKMVGIKVYEFSMGFGPKLLGFRKGETSYNLRLFPLGGFVKMAGMDPNEDEEMAKAEGLEENPYYDSDQGFNKKSVLQRMAVIVAGPIMNFVLATLIFASMAMYIGDPNVPARISKVLPDKPAAQAGLKPGDLITAVNGEKVVRWDQLVQKIEAKGQRQITLTVERAGQLKNIKVTPEVDGYSKRGIIGIQPQKPGVIRAVGLGVTYTGKVVVFLVDIVGKMITQQIPSDGIGGPVRITMEIGKAAKHGILYVAQMTAVLSVNLGLFNLFPIPALDGSRLIFLLWEGLRGRPVDPSKENMIHLVGFGLLLLLMVFITYNDISKIFIK